MTTEDTGKILNVLNLKKQQIFESIQKLYDVSKAINQEAYLAQFKRKIGTLDHNFKEFVSLSERVNILELTLNPKAKITFTDMSTAEEMVGYIKYVEKKITSSPITHSDTSQTDQNSARLIKLQALELPAFGGNQGEWPIFYEMFQANVHRREDLPDAHKLQYLLSKLSGPALSACAGITPSKENYSVIFEALVEKYQDKRNLATHYLDSIFQFKGSKQESAEQLNLFVDRIGASVAALKTLEIANLCEFILFYIASTKLDDVTKRLFENTLKKGDLPSFTLLLEFIQNQAKVLARIQFGNNKIDSGSNNYGSNIKPKPIPSNKGALSHSFFVQRKSKCALCTGDHALYKCTKFLKSSPEERYNVAKQLVLCINCLSAGHRSISCSSKASCSYCHLRHNSLLHFDRKGGVNDGKVVQHKEIEPNGRGVPDNSVSLSVYSPQTESLGPGNALHTTVLLGTVKVLVFDINGVAHEMRFLLDCASMSNVLASFACKQLGFEPKGVSTELKGMGSISSPVQGQVTFKFGSKIDSRCNYTITALVVEHIVDELPVRSVDTSQLSYLKNIKLADNEFMEPGKIYGILGAQIYPYLVSGDPIFGSSGNQPVAIKSSLGYVVLGSAPLLDVERGKKQYCMFQCDFNKFWQLESVPESNTVKLSPEERSCEEIFVNKVHRDSQGIYNVPLPFSSDPTDLGDSLNTALRRFSHLEKKLESNDDLRLNYNASMSELIDRGFMSKCSSVDQCDSSGYFIPHHMVTKPDSPSSKFRIVYDASTKTTSGKSLNDILHIGPKMYSDLFVILLNFRLFPVALNGDITKMFLQIKLLPEYWKFQKILWRFSKEQKLDVYELRVVIFGTKASPYLAQRTVKQLINDEAGNYPLACKYIENTLYMDDCVASFIDEVSAIQFFDEVVKLFSSAGFNFTKWSSNSTQILEHIPASDRLSEIVSGQQDTFAHKILGMHWNTTYDSLYFKSNGISKPHTKRGILASILTMYDPMGLLAPVVLWAKLLIRELCILKLDWDSVPPSHLVGLWQTFLYQLPILEGLSFPRHIGVGKNCKFQLIGFSDASERGYGASIYSRVVSPHGNVNVQLICAKSRVAPLKIESIPRLELCAVMLMASLSKVVVDAYQSRYAIDDIYCFTDSSVALCWSHSSPHRFNTFVGNRISKIQQNMNVENLYHIVGSENPADCLSRGFLPNQFVEHEIYFTGPRWLLYEIDDWPMKSYTEFSQRETPEEKSSIVLLGLDPSNNGNYLLDHFSKYSSYSKLLNVMVYILRFVKKLPSKGFILSEDLNFSESVIIKLLQKHHFQEIIEDIEKGRPCPSSIRKLCPFIDTAGIIRVGGRLRNSNLTFDEKHPLLLPPKNHVVKLLIEYTHKVNCHTGPHLLLCLLRQRFWIMGARNFIRKITQACNVCFRTSPKRVYPKMGELPSSRVLESRPFFHTACDFIGPFHVFMQRKRGARPVKVYISLFICLAIKAVHLEVVSDLSTGAFLNAFKRFICRRGPIKSVLSDNGTNFVGAKNQLNELNQLFKSEDFKQSFSNHLLQNRIEWTFNPPSSPHFGGIYEGNVKSFKSHFFRVVGSQLLTYEEFLTLTVQIESLLNSRPLCTLSSDPSDQSILTPNHFLNLTALKFIPAKQVGDVPTNRLTRFQLLDQMVQSYWKRWSLEYLSQLQVREKWNTVSNPVKLGMVVLIMQENLAPLSWPMGIISEVYPGKDGVIRVALVRTARGEFKRPVCKLCPLPTQ